VGKLPAVHQGEDPKMHHCHGDETFPQKGGTSIRAAEKAQEECARGHSSEAAGGGRRSQSQRGWRTQRRWKI